MIVATIVNIRLPFVPQVRAGLILQFRGTRAVLASRLLPGFKRQPHA